MDFSAGETRKAQVEGKRSRQACEDALLDLFTSPDSPFTSDQMRELSMLSVYFPDASEPLNAIDRKFADKPDLRKSLLLALAVGALERMMTDPEPVEKHVSATERLAARLGNVAGKGTSRKVRRVVPEG